MSFLESQWNETLTLEQRKEKLSVLFPEQSLELIEHWAKIKLFGNLPIYVTNALLGNERTHDDDFDNFDLS